MSDTNPSPESEEARVRRLIDARLSELTGQDVSVILPGDPGQPEIPEAGFERMTLKDILAQVDPTDSDSAIELFNWLVDNHRLHKVATLEQGGYLFGYQEPKGATREGWTAGGTQGDRIVDDALAQAKASGNRSIKGLCRHCFSPITQATPTDEGGVPEAETPRPGSDPTVCDKNEQGQHEFAA